MVVIKVIMVDGWYVRRHRSEANGVCWGRERRLRWSETRPHEEDR